MAKGYHVTCGFLFVTYLNFRRTAPVQAAIVILLMRLYESFPLALPKLSMKPPPDGMTLYKYRPSLIVLLTELGFKRTKPFVYARRYTPEEV